MSNVQATTTASTTKAVDNVTSVMGVQGVCKDVLDQIKILMSDKDAKSHYWQVVIVVGMTFMLALLMAQYMFELTYNFRSAEFWTRFGINVALGVSLLMVTLVPYKTMKPGPGKPDPLRNMRTGLGIAIGIIMTFLGIMLLSSFALVWW
jgi:hypothetical protein